MNPLNPISSATVISGGFEVSFQLPARKLSVVNIMKSPSNDSTKGFVDSTITSYVIKGVESPITNTYKAKILAIILIMLSVLMSLSSDKVFDH